MLVVPQTSFDRENEFIKSKARLRKKFEQLSGKPTQVNTNKNTVKSAILNLTQRDIPNNQIDLLNLGPKFVPAYEKVPIMDIITSTEIAANELEQKDLRVNAERLRHDVTKILSKYNNKKLPSNLDRNQLNALKELRTESDLKVVPFDKGTGFALLENNDMISKINEQIGEAKIISNDPTNTLVQKFQREVRRLLKEKKIDKNTYFQMYPSDAVPPRMYGLIKAHKAEKNFPMRCVVSTIGTPPYGASKYLVDLFQPTLDKNEIRVKNSTSFVNEAKNWKISKNEVQVSYDVVALYPSIPVQKAIEAMIDIVNSDIENLSLRTKLNIQDIRILLKLCLSKCYFLWNENIYLIEDSGPIGLSLMVVIAEGYLQFLEKKAIQTSLALNISPKSYKRYVDDSHARFSCEEDSEKFLEILNEQDEKIQYTVEKQNDNAELSFLDIKVINNRLGNYEFKVFRKDAITNVQIKPSSSVNPSIIKGVFKGFLARAKRICSQKFLAEEIDFLIKVFAENGHEKEQLTEIAQSYSVSTIERIPPRDTTEIKPQVKVPWIPVLGPKLRAIMKKYGVKIIFSSGPNLENLLCNNKSKLPNNSHPGVYKLQCECAGIYIGETKKRVHTRIAEHEKDIFKGRWANSGATEHAKTCPHTFKWNQAATLANESNFRRRKIREALEIRRYERSNNNVINRDQGQLLNTSQWNAILGKLKIEH